MANRIEIKQVTYKGEWYTCTIKHVILANGTSGNHWLDSARNSGGARVTDQALLDVLARLI